MQHQIHASTAGAPATAASRSRTLFRILYLLDAFVVGGLAALLAVHRLLESIRDRLLTIEAAQEILNVQDHLLPYYAAYIGAFLALALLTLGVWLWRALRRYLNVRDRLLPYYAAAYIGAFLVLALGIWLWRAFPR